MNDQLYKQYIIILAGGFGTRMKSTIPKQLLNVGMDPMIVHLLRQANFLNLDVLLVLSEQNKDIILSTLINRKYIVPISEYIYKYQNIIINIIIQPIANGTGGAIIATQNFLKSVNNNSYNQNSVIVLCADVPLISTNTIKKIFHKLNTPNNEYKGIILTKNTANNENFGYGRIVLEQNIFKKIVEQKDCNEEEKQITLINTGIYAFNIDSLLSSLKYLTNNNSQNEYYLTDCPRIINEFNPGSIELINDDDYILTYNETIGANTSEQLEILRNEYLKKFTIENINKRDENITDENLIRLIKILEQLTLVDINYNDKSSLEKIRFYIKNNPKITKIVKYEDYIIGTGSLLIEDKIIHNFGKVGHIEDIVIDKDFRGLGLAKRLVIDLVELAKEIGCYKVILDASDEVAGLYTKCGFTKSANNMRINLKN